MNDFEKMQQIYEEGFLGQSAQVVSYGPNIKYTPHNPHTNTMAREPGQLPFQSGGSRGSRRYDAGLAGQNITRIVDEEIPEKKISNSAVIKKIEELIQRADEEENPTCTYALAELMKHVKGLPEAK